MYQERSIYFRNADKHTRFLQVVLSFRVSVASHAQSTQNKFFIRVVLFQCNTGSCCADVTSGANMYLYMYV